MAEFGIEAFHWQGEQNDVELQLCLAYRMDSGLPSFLDATGAPLLHGPARGHAVAKCWYLWISRKLFNPVAGRSCVRPSKSGYFSW